jgi:hypothetical protein
MNDRRFQSKLIRNQKKNKPMARQSLREASQFCELRPNHVCEVSRRLFQLRIQVIRDMVNFLQDGLSIQ